MSATEIDVELERALALLEALFADATVGLGLFDDQLRYLRVNDVLRDIIGVPEDQLYGRRISEVLGAFGRSAEAVQRGVLETGVAARNVELIGRTPADPERPHTYLCSYFQLRGQDGEVVGLASVVQDETARLHAQLALEVAHERLDLLSTVGKVVGSSLSTRDTLAALAELTVPRFADHCIVDLVEPGHRETLRRVALVHTEEVRAEGERAWRGSEGEVDYPPEHPVTRVRATGSPLLVKHVPTELPDTGQDPDSVGAAFTRQVGVRSLLVLPLLGRGGVLGVVSFAVSLSGRRYDESDLELAVEIAGRFTVALENARAYESRSMVALTLQRAMLPQGLPPAEGLDPESVYLPGGPDTEVGGDWFDLIPLSTGRTGVVIGDVMGRGVHAAAVMGQLRAATRSFAVLDLAPERLLRHLDELVMGLDTVDLVTCVYGVFDPATGTMTLANAGHLPPLLLRAGHAERVDLDTGTLLGTGTARFVQRDIVLDDGDALVLYTDGLVESRGSDLDDGIDRLCATLAVEAPPGGTCEAAVRALISADSDHDDDVAMLVLRRRMPEPGHEPLTLPLPASASSPRAAREAVHPALVGWGVPGDLAETVTLLVSELVTNAVLHTGSSPLVHVREHAGAVYVEVEDADPRPPRMREPKDDEDGGRGLHLVEALGRRWGVRATTTGKVVWCEITG